MGGGDPGVEGRSLEERRGPRHPRAPPGPNYPALGGSAPAWARRAFPGSELRRGLPAGRESGRDLERPPGGPDAPFTGISPRTAPRPALAFPSTQKVSASDVRVRIWES